jgi:hypothetical protein
LKTELDSIKQLMAAQKKEARPVVTDNTNVAAAALVDVFKGDGTGPTVREFFQQIKQAAALGHWSDDDKTRVVVLKFKGTAATFLSTKFDLSKPLTFGEVEKAFLARFLGKHTDQFNFMNLQNAVQKRGESVAQFSERVRQLGALTVRQTGDPATQKVVDEEAERRMLASFLHGLQGKPGEVTRFRFPTKWEDAVQWALLVEAEEASKPSESGATVFQLTCWSCKKPGHRESECRSRQRDVRGDNRRYGRQDDRGVSSDRGRFRGVSPGAGRSNYRANSGERGQSSERGRRDSYDRGGYGRGRSPSGRVPDNRRVRFDMSGARRRAFEVSEVTCYRCDRRGHYARDCRVGDNGPMVGRVRGANEGRNSRDPSPLNPRGPTGRN